jgi:hypothetical protein
LSGDNYEDNKETQEQESGQEQKTEQETDTRLTRKLKGQQHLIELRRAKVSQLWSQGLNQYEIAAEVHVTQAQVSYDIAYLKQQAREQIRTFVTEKLPVTVSKTFVSLDLVTTKLWAMVAEAERDGDNKVKLQALSQINQVEAQKIDIVSNLGIVDQVTTTAEGLQQKQQQQVSDSQPVVNREEEAEEELTEGAQ